MFKIALCDDEQKMLDEASQYINNYVENNDIQALEICLFNSAKSLINALDDDTTFDIFILDVYIGEELGTELARNIRKRGIDSPIIFLTSSIEHAPQGYETGTLRYLLKPLDPAKFYEAMDAALVQVERMSELLIKFKSENGIETVNANHIIYSEAQAHYQHLNLIDGSQVRVRMTVAELYAVLLKYDGFARVGSSYVVNLRNIMNVSSREVHLTNNIIIPIPRGRNTELKNAFWEFQYNRQEE